MPCYKVYDAMKNILTWNKVINVQQPAACVQRNAVR